MQTQRRNPPAGRDVAGLQKKVDSENGLRGDPIISELRRLYNGVVDEPLPDNLLELLRRLDEVERNR
jgi:Anti-sigma factor NepR